MATRLSKEKGASLIICACSVKRYVERNALRAMLVERARDWRWLSLRARRAGQAEQRALGATASEASRRVESGVPVTEGASDTADSKTSGGADRGTPSEPLPGVAEPVADGGAGTVAVGYRALVGDHTTRRLGLESSLRSRGRLREKPAQIKTPVGTGV